MGFGPVFRLIPHLQSLEFTEEGAPGTASLAAILTGLVACPGLVTLSLQCKADGQLMGPRAETQVVQGMSRLASLRELTVGANFRLSASACSSILAGLTALKRLDAGRASLMACVLAPGLAHLTSLSHLDLGGNILFQGGTTEVTITQIVTFASCLSSLTKLKALNLSSNSLSNNCLGSGALESLRQSFPPSLTILSLNSVFASPEVMALVVPGLGRLTNLR